MGSRGTILVVDDEPDLCEMLTFDFRGKGFEAFTALDGFGALDILQSHPITTVITDIRMPNMDGLQLLKQLKAANPLNPAVILISAFIENIRVEAYGAGAEAVFSKPFRVAEVVRTVSRLHSPYQERWGGESPEYDGFFMERHLPNLNPDYGTPSFVLGRGGAMFAAADSLPQPGQCIAFSLTFEDGPIRSLKGHGTVRWTKGTRSSFNQASFGVEFDYLDDFSRQQYVMWLLNEKPKAFIPIMP